MLIPTTTWNHIARQDSCNHLSNRCMKCVISFYTLEDMFAIVNILDYTWYANAGVLRYAYQRTDSDVKPRLDSLYHPSPPPLWSRRQTCKHTNIQTAPQLHPPTQTSNSLRKCHLMSGCVLI
ncbi:hypothetical protein B1J92_G06446g [Nakaseomyces glabratus]|nr:hypothetical protein B1J91_G06446g [Nakaseomyces glabratus]OXB48709.1 hypothetical protein B1J92_G06446g [Nakaseomyces glabratus]